MFLNGELPKYNFLSFFLNRNFITKVVVEHSRLAYNRTIPLIECQFTKSFLFLNPPFRGSTKLFFKEYLPDNVVFFLQHTNTILSFYCDFKRLLYNTVFHKNINFLVWGRGGFLMGVFRNTFH